MDIPKIPLSSKTAIPQVGLGMWKVKKQTECQQAIKWALEAGYRHFDTAQYYQNEQFLGEVLAEGLVPREEVFITTKIANDNFFEDEVGPSFEASLRRLETDYVDLLLLHFPVTNLRQAAWRKLEQFAGDGRAKAIGVSNYTVRHLKELLSACSIKPAVNQVELHVFLQQPELLEYCRQNGIAVEAYSPLAHGHGLNDPVLQKLAEKHGKTTAQIMLRWCVQQGTVPLPKSVHEDRIQQNIDIFDFELDDADMQELAKLDKNLRTCWDPTDVQ
jgi:diketogulonate reductase-like aldo/keto reductase